MPALIRFSACHIRATDGTVRPEYEALAVISGDAIATAPECRQGALFDQFNTATLKESDIDDNRDSKSVERQSLEHQPERTDAGREWLKEMQPYDVGDQGVLEIPETPSHSFSQDKTLSETKHGKSHISKAVPIPAVFAGENGKSVNARRRYSFPGSIIPSPFRGTGKLTFGSSDRPLVSTAARLLTPCKRMGLSEGPSTMGQRGQTSSSERGPRADDQLPLGSHTAKNLAFSSHSTRKTEPRLHLPDTETLPHPTRPPTMTENIPSNQARTMSRRSSPLITIHPLGPDDTMVLTALVDDSKQLADLSTSLSAWKLPQSLPSARLNVISIKVLADHAWLVMAKISAGIVLKPNGTSSSLYENSPNQLSRKRKVNRLNSDLDLDSNSENDEVVGLSVRQSHRPRQARHRAVASVDSQSNSDTAGSPGIQRPNLKRGGWTQTEDLRLTRLVEAGHPWSAIVARFPRRSEPAVRSRWNCVLKPLAS